MKFSAAIFALCAFQATAFSIQTPKAKQAVGPLYSSLQNSGPLYSSLPTTGVQETQGMQDMQGMSRSTGAPRSAWDTQSQVLVQGGTLKTWSFPSPTIDRVQVFLKTEGRPLNANVELWQGPDNTPQKMQVYLEDGSLRPFSAVIETPRGTNAIAVRNTGDMEFPLAAVVKDNVDGAGAARAIGSPKTIQGGALKTYAFEPNVDAVQVLLTTDGRPLNARVELLQGPNNDKQVIELYTEDGMERPFFATIETPGTGNVVRIVNTATIEYPLSASVEPF